MFIGCSLKEESIKDWLRQSAKQVVFEAQTNTTQMWLAHLRAAAGLEAKPLHSLPGASPLPTAQLSQHFQGHLESGRQPLRQTQGILVLTDISNSTSTSRLGLLGGRRVTRWDDRGPE